MDFLHHKMLKAGLFGCLGIPFDFRQLLFDRLLVHIVERNLALSQTCHLQVTDIINLTGIFQNCRHIAGHIAFAVMHADNHRAVLACDINFTGIFLKHHSQGIRAANAYHSMAQCISRCMVILFIVIVNQLNGDLGVRLGIKGIAVMQQLFLQLLIVFDNTVMHCHHVAISTNMRMRVSFGGFAVRCPTCVTNTAGAYKALSAVGFGI